MSQFLCVFEILPTPGSLSRSLDPRRNALPPAGPDIPPRREPRLAEADAGVATAGCSTTDHPLTAPARRDFLAVARRHPRRAGRRSEFSAPPLSARWSFSALLQPARTPSLLAAAALHGTGPRWTRNSPPLTGETPRATIHSAGTRLQMQTLSHPAMAKAGRLMTCFPIFSDAPKLRSDC